MKLLLRSVGLMFFSFSIMACSPDVGSDEWCAAMREKPKGDWSTNEFSDYTSYCIFK